MLPGISQKQWKVLKKELKSDLKTIAKEGCLTQNAIFELLKSRLTEFSSTELVGILVLHFEDRMSMASAVSVVLEQAIEPLHIEEIAKRTEKLLGKKVSITGVSNACLSEGVWLYGRGIYGTIEHCPLQEPDRMKIRAQVEGILMAGNRYKQWHSKEIIEQLRHEINTNFSALALNPYTLRMCLDGSKKVVYLNRMAWARTDSGFNIGDKKNLHDAIVEILEGAGLPLTKEEIKKQLAPIRGVYDDMQIQPVNPLVRLSSKLWGLSYRDKQ